MNQLTPQERKAVEDARERIYRTYNVVGNDLGERLVAIIDRLTASSAVPTPTDPPRKGTAAA